VFAFEKKNNIGFQKVKEFNGKRRASFSSPRTISCQNGQAAYKSTIPWQAACKSGNPVAKSADAKVFGLLSPLTQVNIVTLMQFDLG
jgi:hypothetical protein